MNSSLLKLTLATACAFAAVVAPASAAVVPIPPKPVTLHFLGASASGGNTAAEVSAFHSSSERLFSTDALNNQLDILDLSNPSAPAPISSVSLAPYGAVPNSVTVSPVCGGRVVVAMEKSPKTDPGTLELFDINGNHLDSVATGAQPDMVTVNDGGLRFVSANEGEPASDGSVNPEGSITVALMRRCNDFNSSTFGFAGAPTTGPVRTNTPGATFAQDIEPEYVSIDPGGVTAAVTLQDNNAVAKVNLVTRTVISVTGLGFKDHSIAGKGLDPSDRDPSPGAINIGTFANVLGMYQPDAIADYRLPGDLFPRYVTANEGDSRDWAFFSDEKRAKDLPLDPVAFPAAVKTDAKLGRLTVSSTDGDTDNDGDLDKLYVFGGRSISVLGHSGALTWDSGDAIEQYVKANDSANWNVEGASGGFDSRSDNKGPEPEGIVTGKVAGRMYAFANMERQGGIFAFDLRATPGQAKIAGYVNTRATTTAPESIIFIAPSDSPTGKALLVTSNEVSGNVGVYEVRP